LGFLRQRQPTSLPPVFYLPAAELYATILNAW
jgi:hypothetical protein